MTLSPTLAASDSNFAGLIEADGSVLAVGRYHVYKCPHWNDTTSCVATLVPHSGNGAKATATASSKAGGMIGEDPFLYRDPRNANLTKTPVLHMLRHVGRDTHDYRGNNGGHQFSTDGARQTRADAVCGRVASSYPARRLCVGEAEGRSWSECIDNCTTAYPGRADFTGAQPTIARVVHSVCSSLTALVFSGRRQPHADDDAGAPPFGFRRGWAYTDCADERSSAGALHWHRERLLLHSPTEDTAVMDLDRGRRPIPVQQFLADGDR